MWRGRQRSQKYNLVTIFWSFMLIACRYSPESICGHFSFLSFLSLFSNFPFRSLSDWLLPFQMLKSALVRESIRKPAFVFFGPQWTVPRTNENIKIFLIKIPRWFTLVFIIRKFFEILFGSVRIYLSKLRQPWELWYWTADDPSVYE